MKAVILAGGLGTRLSEETHLKPKPMLEIGGMPILWHIMKTYSYHGVNEFIICCGYKGYIIKEYFANYYLHMSDVTFDLNNNQMTVHQNSAEPWTVTLVDTGIGSLTGDRLKKIGKFVENEEFFCMTYGDGVTDSNIAETINFHKSHGKLATLTAMRPPGRYGVLKISEQNSVENFQEKPEGDGSWISGGYFVLSPKVLDYIGDEPQGWVGEPLSMLADSEELVSYKHEGFWQPMDTLREKNHLNQLWDSGEAPWKVWD